MDDSEPPMKKTKLTSDWIDMLDDYMKTIDSNENNLVPILSDDIEETLPVVQVYVGCIADVKQISYIIKVLNEKLPLNELQHLKRVRLMKVILCKSRCLENSQTIQEFLEVNLPELQNSFQYFEEISAPSQSPRTKKQFKEAKKLWSCNFHPNTYLEKLVSGKFFSPTELSIHKTYMSVVLFIAKWFVQNTNFQDETKNSFKNLNAAVVVDPLIKSIVAIAFDRRRHHPMQHAAMLAIDNVAKTQKGGAWALGTENSDLPGCSKQLLSSLNKEFPKVLTGSRSYISKIESQGTENGPYLCTNYDIYMLKEPCIMCSMALTHARIKRVFFALDNLESGGLKSRTKLHTVGSLNHHFEVFTGFFPMKDESLNVSEVILS